MKLDLMDMLYAMSFALDKVESELLGIGTGHGGHVAYLSFWMGKAAGYQEEELRDFVGCCLLHDNALTEYIYQEFTTRPLAETVSEQISELQGRDTENMHHEHSVIGELNIHLLPFHTDVKDIVRLHHENADGTGVLGLSASETNLKSQITHLADMVDTMSRLTTMTEAEFHEMCKWVKENEGSLFSEESVALFLQAIDYGKIAELQERGAYTFLREELPQEILDYSDEEIRNIAKLFAKIVDYKSEFMQDHSKAVAEKAEIMAHYYGFDDDKAIRFYFAGALHDIGKLVVTNDILEKQDHLTLHEYEEMQNHAVATRYILSQMKEISDIVGWASNHHEKLNGTGYPRGLTARELSFEDRLMACIDTYQALIEKRSNKDGMSHESAITIMLDMAQREELDGGIVRDLDAVLGAHD